MIKSFADLHIAASEKIKNGCVIKVGVIYPTDIKYMTAIKKAVNEGYIVPTLIGPKSKLEKLSSGFDIIDVADSKQAGQIAFDKASNNEFDLLLKCNIKTRDFVDLLDTDQGGLVTKKAGLTQISVIQTQKYHKLMFLTDGGVTPEPDAAQLINIIKKAAQVCHKLGNKLPKAGLLAAVEAIYPAIPTTMTAAAIAKMSERGQIKNVLIDGPLSFDVAISTKVAHLKGITDSKVAGDADIFVMPNMATADGVYKAMVMFAKAKSASILYGADIPIALSATVDTPETIYNAIILGALLV